MRPSIGSQMQRFLHDRAVSKQNYRNQRFDENVDIAPYDGKTKAEMDEEERMDKEQAQYEKDMEEFDNKE